jgi:hypothetical protein
LAAWCFASAGRVRRACPDYTVADFFRAFPIRPIDHVTLIRQAFGQLGVRD